MYRNLQSFAYDGKTVIVTATLAEIKKAERGKGEMDSRKLVRVPSKAARAKLYEEAAAAIAAREGAALPGHGGRPWTCDVRLVDDSRPKRKNAGPLFRWYRGRLELAVVPHYLEKIEEVDAGIRTGRRHRDDDPPSSDEYSDDDDEDDMYSHIPKTLLQQREVSALSTVAWEDPDHPGKLLLAACIIICEIAMLYDMMVSTMIFMNRSIALYCSA